LADTVTDALVAAVPDPPAEPWRTALDDARRALAVLAARRRAGGPCRITDHEVRVGLHGPAPGPTREAPFAWSGRTARRTLGLSAVRALVSGQASTPVEAMRARVADASRLVREGTARTSSLDHWLDGLSPAARAAVGAEAVTWATRLWCALDWERLEAPVVGRDHWWDSPHSSLLALRSRAEVRTACADLVVLAGPRRDSVRAELALVMLVESLLARNGSPPGRVVGWWPESGHVVRLDPGPAALVLGVAAVAHAVGCRPVGSATRAAPEVIYR
jgi:hypothetical protein